MDSPRTEDAPARNAYGSLMEEVDVEGDESMSEQSESQEGVSCSCKGQCCRAKGRGACPCKAANQSCNTERCSCNAGKCKNKSEEEPNGTPAAGQRNDPDGEVQFARDVQVSLVQIQEFVGSLGTEQKDNLLTSLLAMGRGSLDFAKNLLDAGNDPPEPPAGPPPEWCKCRRCRPMETEIENVCCKRVNCITLRNDFSNICLDRDNLEVTIKERCDYRADEFDFSMESFRKAAYRRYTIWTYGKLGRGNRKVVPSCVVWVIRDCYRSANERYMGFRRS